MPSGYKTKFYLNFAQQANTTNNVLSDVFDLLAADGIAGPTQDGFIVDSRAFTTTVPYGPLGRLDYYKWLAITQQNFKLSEGKNLFEAWISGEQFFGSESNNVGGTADHNLGSGFLAIESAVYNLQEDPRIASSGMFIYDDENDMMYGHMLTNQAHYALYSRSNFNQLAAIAPTTFTAAPAPPLYPNDPDTTRVVQLQQALISQGYLTLDQVTNPVSGDGLGIYGPNTTLAVTNLQNGLSSVIPGVYDDATAAALFVATNQVMALLGLTCPLDEQNLQPAFVPPTIDTSVQPLNIAGTSYQSAKYKYGTCAVNCAGYTSRYGNKKACNTKCNPCGAKTAGSSFEQLMNLNARYYQNYRYTQPFNQIYGGNYFGSQALAPHLNWFQLQNRESESPISNFVKVGIEFDNTNGTVNYYINEVLQQTVLHPGLLPQEDFRGVLQDGNIARTVSCNVRVAFGTFSFLDSALTLSYSKLNTAAANANSTNALLPLDYIDNYNVPYGGVGGNYGSTNVGSNYFAYQWGIGGNPPQVSNRLFGQGAALVIKDLHYSVCKSSGKLHDELEYLDNNPCCPAKNKCSSSSSSSSSCSSSSSSSSECCKKKKSKKSKTCKTGTCGWAK